MALGPALNAMGAGLGDTSTNGNPLGSFLNSIMGLFGQGSADQGYAKSMGNISQWLQGIMGQGMGNLSPYMAGGQQGMGMEGNFLGRLQTQAANFNPQTFLNQAQSGYTQTPYAKYMTGVALGGANNASAISGMLGSPQNAMNNSSIANNIASGDFQNYIQNLMGEQGIGLNMDQMLSSGNLGMAGIGANAATSGNNFLSNMANINSNAMQNQAAAQSASTQSNDSLIGNILGFLL